MSWHVAGKAHRQTRGSKIGGSEAGKHGFTAKWRGGLTDLSFIVVTRCAH